MIEGKREEETRPPVPAPVPAPVPVPVLCGEGSNAASVTEPPENIMRPTRSGPPRREKRRSTAWWPEA